MLLDYEKTLDCVHCGLCLPHCPTYQETGRESSSPRGRIYAMRGVAEGRIPLDDAIVDEMYQCLACRACESACPAGVQYGTLVESIRAEIDLRGARPRRTRWLQRLAFRGVVGRPGVLHAAMGLLRVYQRTGAQSALRASGLLRAIPNLAAAERMLPAVPDAHRPPELVAAVGPVRGRVAFFRGCLMPEMFGPTNAATVRVLARNGFEVSIPSAQRCCGALHIHSGDARGGEKLRERNLAAFDLSSVDAVVTNSAGCGAALA